MSPKTLFYLSILLINSTFVACSIDSGKTESSSLPYLGRHNYVEKTINDQSVVDTIYHQVSDFRFVDQDSSVITPSTFDDKIYVADFFFTSCPTICPVMKTQMLRVYEAFKEEDEVVLLSHTIDPQHDTVALLHDYAERLGVSSDKWHFVTGEKEKIYEMGLNSYMVTAMEDDEEPGGFIHSGAFILVDKEGHVRGMYDGTKEEKVDILIKDMEKLLNEYRNKDRGV
ncbi:protein SCO1/2 [Catalinimonas alkaloidigena]|uniref:SCO family protein n=1 Tax=Catalinimonas alkaloidigena TaxID=1075417 RepID=UPI0024062BF7|nr:SCO family protein [Catalinimonas alkaloidigena]MDF9796171.1 protein SCO1/2 [Catalinimonas alkaloidigena]